MRLYKTDHRKHKTYNSANHSEEYCIDRSLSENLAFRAAQVAGCGTDGDTLRANHLADAGAHKVGCSKPYRIRTDLVGGLYLKLAEECSRGWTRTLAMSLIIPL